MGLSLRGQTSGAIDINAPNVAGDNTITLPGTNGAANQFYRNSRIAGIVTYSSMIEDSSGRIGIGLTNPTGKLHTIGDVMIQGEGGTGEQSLFIGKSATVLPNSRGVAVAADQNASAFHDMVLKTSTNSSGLVERVRITSDGTILAGGQTSSYDGGFVNLELRKDSTTVGGSMTLVNHQSATAGATCQIDCYQNFRAAGRIVFGRENANNWEAAAGGAASFLSFHTNNAGTEVERLRITSTGRIQQKANNEDIDMDATASGQLQLDGNGYSAAFALNAQGLNIYTNSPIRGIIFGTNETEKLRIQSGGGISFNGDTAAANALDDYEEGTWTPVYRGNTTAGIYTYNDQLGTYTKIGRSVTISVRLTNITESSAADGYIEITGLPYAAEASMAGGGVQLNYFNVGASAVSIVFVIGTGENKLLIYQVKDSNVSNPLDESLRQNNSSDIIGSLTYNTTT